MSTPSIRPLNSQLQLIAQEELHEKPNQIKENLEILKLWLQQSAHISARTDDQFLIAFLRGCKYSLEKTKRKIDMYYTYRTHLTEIVGNQDPLDDKINQVIKLGVTLPLPVVSPGSPKVLLFRANSYDPSSVRIENVMKVANIINNVLLNEDDNYVISGLIFIVDLAGISMAHLTQTNPAFLKKTIMIQEESSPVRQKGVHYINAPTICEQFLVLFKSLLSEKLKGRLHIHPSLDSLYSVVPRDVMPTEYDGKAGSLQTLTDEWEKKLLSYRDYLLDDGSKYGVDEKKRIGASNNPLLGIEGTFKRLEVD